ncbi:MAG TPA: branched-chain amino acid ABC transporter permease [Acidimicrobiales bacterium]|nr:branched-chain amino acid ABC transporter permease [Acidimicrobiales bacterium]
MAVASLERDVVAERRATTVVQWLPRIAAWLVIAYLVLLMPLRLDQFHSDRFALGVIYAIVALSLNVLIGYAGQISLGHQGFFGVGAFTSAFVVTSQGQSFWVGLIAAGIGGAISSALMGLVALRVKGLYLALVTLAYGRLAQESLFLLPAFGGGAGIEAPRPAGFVTDRAYYYLCLMVLVVVVYTDWRFVKSKAGRAVNALRENEQVASSYAVNIRTYKLLAFVIAGIFVGLAGALFAARGQRVVAGDFEFQLALLFVIMTVVGGIRDRVGVVIGGVFFALFSDYLADFLDKDWAHNLLPQFVNENRDQLGSVVGAVLLVITLIKYPGGIGQQLRPVRSWLTGGPFSAGHSDGFVEEGVRGRP